MLGQEKIIDKINTLTLDTCPRTLMLVGELGSGRHTICNHISKVLNLPIQDITEIISYELIEEIYGRVNPFIYIIDEDKLSVKYENAILKFLEEPLKNSYIVMLCENSATVLPTIISRCQIWELNRYTPVMLKSLFPQVNDLCLQVTTTPGQVILYSTEPLQEMYELANRLIEKIGVANFPNTLSLSNRIKFKDGDQGKYDIKIFAKILLYCINKKSIENSNSLYFMIHILTSNFISTLGIKNVDCKNVFENYLTKLRFMVRGAE